VNKKSAAWVVMVVGEGGGQGAAKQKSVTPVVGGWVRGQKRTKAEVVFSIFFVVFFYSPHRETRRNVMNKTREKIGFGFLAEFSVKTFRRHFFVKRFLWCF
jgi:hypothetical protein